MVAHTEYAPSERATWQELYDQITSVRHSSSFRELLEAMPGNVMLLNAHRQIVFANQPLLRMLNISDPAEAYGCRPGEILHCIHAKTGEGGCGTAKPCRLCGLLQAFLASQDGEADIRECTIRQTGNDQGLNLLVRSAPVHLESSHFVLVSIAETRKNEAHTDKSDNQSSKHTSPGNNHRNSCAA